MPRVSVLLFYIVFLHRVFTGTVETRCLASLYCVFTSCFYIVFLQASPKRFDETRGIASLQFLHRVFTGTVETLR
ncbi:MAG: hypothetical protein VSS75_014770 [Candidatus Parabeggiatoa sp.]|nr:hypothetical protein [Candidatus Parabeggiatoa sp.]